MASREFSDGNSVKDLKHLNPDPPQLLDGQGEVLLFPIPHLDPADPLNWPAWRRWTILGFLSLWAATSLAAQSFISNILPSIERDFASASPSEINLLVTIITAVCAPSSLIFVPILITYGRRFALLVSNTILLVSLIWAALATSYSSFLGARILQAVGTSPSDAIVYILVQDISFVHERGKLMGVVLNIGYGLFYLLSTVVPFMSTTPSYKGPYWLFSGLTIFCMLGFFFFMPEVYYDRTQTSNPQTTMTAAQHKSLKQSLSQDSNNRNSGLARKLSIWSGRASGPESDFFLIYKRMGRLLLNPTMWWNGLMNAIITG
ncbi:Protein HOL1 [Penicillium rolfsii]|nr:Protein HOL1 [Penicillium rolfsii]